jgi:hypothetical protein
MAAIAAGSLTMVLAGCSQPGQKPAAIAQPASSPVATARSATIAPRASAKAIPAASPAATSTMLVFPDTSMAQAESVQAAEEDGDQPWRLDPASIAATYCISLRWTTSPATAATYVTQVNPSTYDIANPLTGEVLRLFMIQPVQTGSGGIWDISSVQQLQPPA